MIILSELLKIVFFISRGGSGLCRSLLSGWSGLVESNLRFDEWMVVWDCRDCRGSSLASLLTILLLVSAVWPVAMRAIWFCTI